jgi:hypothetical protein
VPATCVTDTDVTSMSGCATTGEACRCGEYGHLCAPFSTKSGFDSGDGFCGHGGCRSCRSPLITKSGFGLGGGSCGCGYASFHFSFVDGMPLPAVSWRAVAWVIGSLRSPAPAAGQATNLADADLHVRFLSFLTDWVSVLLSVCERALKGC